MLFGEGPQIKNIAADLNKLFRQGSMLNQSVQNVEGDSTADQGTSDLLAARDPVIQEISVGMSGEQAARYTVSGVPPLTLPNSLGKPLKAWSVEVSPYQEGTGDPSPSNVRPIHGTDKVSIYTDSKYGGLVEWNQMIYHGNFDSISGLWGRYNASFTISNGIATVTPTASISRIYQNIDIVLGHKYLMHAEFKGTSGNAMLSWYGGTNQFVPFTGEWQDVNLLLTNTFQTATNWQLHYGSTSNSQMDEYQIKNAMCFDLTQMFGAGNEPTTVEAFRALFPLDYYAYNAGQQMTVDQVNGAQYTPAVITLPQTVYTATISEQGGESRSTIVDMGAQDWIYHSGHDVFYYLTSDGKPTGTGQSGYGMCEAYNVMEGTYYTALTDGQIAVGTNFVSAATASVVVKDTRFTDAAQFKAAVAGIKLVYEIADPDQFPLTAPTIPTPTDSATAWATAEDGIVDSMEVTYVGKA